MNKKTIIVTGGFGTVGFALTESLLEKGHKVIAVDTKIKRIKNDNLVLSFIHKSSCTPKPTKTTVSATINVKNHHHLRKMLCFLSDAIAI